MDKTAPCVHCRESVQVPDSYADGDHIKCGTCGTQHKVQRRESALRLVIADVTPLREALTTQRQRIELLEAQWQHARASLGIGAYGLGVGLIYLLIRIGWDEELLTTGLMVKGALIAFGTGLLLEVMNYFFLAKRQKMSRLSEEIEEAEDVARDLQRQIREATRR